MPLVSSYRITKYCQSVFQ